MRKIMMTLIAEAEYFISDDIWGDAQAFFETKNGNVDIREWAWYDADFGVEVGMGKVMGGTGAFEGAFGSLSFMPKWPVPNGIFIYKGYICLP